MRREQSKTIMINLYRMTSLLSLLRLDAYPYYAGIGKAASHRWQDNKFSNIFHSLSDSELDDIIYLLNSDTLCPRNLLYKAEGIKHYRDKLSTDAIPIKTLLTLYTDKASGKVVFSAKELKLRYEKVSEDDRHAILKAFLLGSKTDIEWAAHHLGWRWLYPAPGRKVRQNQWVPSLSDEIGVCWKRTHNPKVGRLVVENLPTEFILTEQENLARVLGYTAVCARLFNEEGFFVDRSRLSLPDYLYVIAKNNQTTKEDVDALLDEYLSQEPYLSEEVIGRIVWSLGKMRMTDSLLRFLPEMETRQHATDIVDCIIENLK